MLENIDLNSLNMRECIYLRSAFTLACNVVISQVNGIKSPKVNPFLNFYTFRVKLECFTVFKIFPSNTYLLR